MKSLGRSSFYVLLVAGVKIALATGFLWLHLATPFDGVRLQPDAQVWRPNGVGGDAAARTVGWLAWGRPCHSRCWALACRLVPGDRSPVAAIQEGYNETLPHE